MSASSFGNPASLANPFVTHVYAALWWLVLVTRIATLVWVKWLITV
jgi:hypothetical protein